MYHQLTLKIYPETVTLLRSPTFSTLHSKDGSSRVPFCSMPYILPSYLPQLCKNGPKSNCRADSANTYPSAEHFATVPLCIKGSCGSVGYEPRVNRMRGSPENDICGGFMRKTTTWQSGHAASEKTLDCHLSRENQRKRPRSCCTGSLCRHSSVWPKMEIALTRRQAKANKWHYPIGGPICFLSGQVLSFAQSFRY